MEDNIEKEIQEIRAIAEDNQKILKKLHKALIFERIKTIVYWVLIIGIAIGAFVFLQPYLEGVFDAYDSIRTGFQQGREVHESFSSGSVQDYFQTSESSSLPQ